jgi:hypothetical protein
MTPQSAKEAVEAGWKELTRKEVEQLRGEHGLESFAVVDCNFASEGSVCGGFGETIKCFCHNGLCVCYRAP